MCERKKEREKERGECVIERKKENQKEEREKVRYKEWGREEEREFIFPLVTKILK